MLSLLSRHGRATPLVWLTVDKAALKNRRNGYEYQVLVRLAEILPADVRVRIVADRGFGDHKLYRVLTEELKFDFVIRFRGNITVTATDGEARAATDWVGAGGRARTLRGAAVTAQAYPVATVVCVRAKGMKEPWCLAASTADEPARGLSASPPRGSSCSCLRRPRTSRQSEGVATTAPTVPKWQLLAILWCALALGMTVNAILVPQSHRRSRYADWADRRAHAVT